MVRVWTSKGVVFAVLTALGGGCDVVPRQEQAPAALGSAAPAQGAAEAGATDQEGGPAQPEPEPDQAAVEARALARGLEAASKVAQQQGQGKPRGLKLSRPRRTSCDEVTCLIDPKSCGGGCIDTRFRGPRVPVRPPQDTLSRTDILAAISPLRGRVKGCSSGAGASDGTVRVRVTVAASGRATEVQLLPPVDPAVGACIERLVRGLRFRATSGGPTTFTFPFVLGR